MANANKLKKSKSPYKKHNKKPHQYSEQYRAWRSAVGSHGATSSQAREASKRHAARFLNDVTYQVAA